MNVMNQGLNDITVAVEESAKGISGVAEDVSVLVGAISTIMDECTSNQGIARELENEVSRFEKV